MKKQNINLTKGRLSLGIALGLAGISTGATAQQNNSFGSIPAPLSQQPQANNVPQQINYASGQGSLDSAGPIMIPDNINYYQTNPALAAQAAGALPPQGLPQYTPPPVPAGTQRVQRGGNIDPVDVQLEILNTDNEKIRSLREDMYQKSRVINEGPTNAPLQYKGIINAEVSPGSVSPVVRVSKGITSTIIVTDMTGQPWPIVNMDGLTKEDFIVKRLDNPAPDGYVLSVTPRGNFVSGNLVLILKGLPAPINIEFVPAQKEVDVNTEIRVQARGPNTQFSMMGLPQSMSSELLYILQGIAPQGSKELNTSSTAVQAWLSRDGSMYVRTRYKVMAPAFESVTTSPDGTYAYKMVPVPVVLFKTDDGRFGEFTIEGL